MITFRILVTGSGKKHIVRYNGGVMIYFLNVQYIIMYVMIYMYVIYGLVNIARKIWETRIPINNSKKQSNRKIMS